MQIEKCPYCGKTEFKHKGARNLHLMHCERKHLKEKYGSKEKCTHSWRLLNTKSNIERQAIGQGYSKVCTKCEELE